MKYVILLSAVLISACASMPNDPYISSQASVTQDMARIVFYRPSAFNAMVRHVNVFIEGEPVGVLSNGTYLQRSIEPGVSTIGAKMIPYGVEGKNAVSRTFAEVEYDFKKGRTYYVAWYSSGNSFTKTNDDRFIARYGINPNNPLQQSLLLNFSADFGVIREDVALGELSKCDKAHISVDPNKI